MWLLTLAVAATASPEQVAPRAADYVYGYWPDGWRGAKVRYLESPAYGFALDTERLTVPHFGPLATDADYLAGGALEPARVAALPPAELELTLTLDGRAYRCVGAAPADAHTGPRFIESGRYVQRADVTGLVFADGEGRRLELDARLETIGQPDRLTLLLEASPAPAATPAGPTFGRVGGGLGFDGTNHLATELAAADDPAELTLELWAYLSDEPPATRHYPWLVCRGANEWADGHFGLSLVGAAPRATLDVGGGRDNGFAVTGPPLAGEAWHHLALTYDGAVLRLFVDGAPAGETAVGRRRQPVPGDVCLGRRLDGDGDGYHFRGVLDEVRLWRRALTADELARRAGQPGAPAGQGLEREWAFDRDGPALDRRPEAVWHHGEMTLRLRQAGREWVGRAACDPAAPPTWERPLRAWVTVLGEPGDAPPTAVVARALDGTALPVSYDPAGAWHRVDLDGIGPEGTLNDQLERVRLTLTNNTDQAQPVRLLFDKSGAGFRAQGIQAITGLTPMIRDADGFPTGLPVQLSKNWHSQPGRRLRYQGAWLHAFGLVRLPPRASLVLECCLTYAHWGGVAAASDAQLCLVGWGSNQVWNQAALGSWGETFCCEPDQAQAECLVCDVRPVMVHAMQRDEPTRWSWTNNVGGADLLRIFDPAGRRRFPERMRTTYLRHGPVLTEVVYQGRTGDGLEHRVTTSHWRTDDLARVLYRVRLEVRERFPFSRFVIAQIGADTYSYTGERRVAVGDGATLSREWPTSWGGDAYRTAPLAWTGTAPWASLHQAARRDPSRAGAWANRGLILRAWSARLGGRLAEPYLAERGARVGGVDTSTLDLLPPPGVSELLPGDFVEATLEHLVVPQFARDYYGPNAALRAALERDQDTWRPVAREAAENSMAVEVRRGRLLSRWPIAVAAEDNVAEFELAGGLGYVPVSVTGLTGHRVPRLEILDGGWREVDQSVHGRDFWQADRDPASGTHTITYSLPADSGEESPARRRYRFRLEPREPAR